MLVVLEEAEILRRDGDGLYRFKHKFIYYYFVAKYIKGNLYKESEKVELRRQVSEMARRIYVEDFYFILMFLVYLTNGVRGLSPNACEVEKIVGTAA